MELMLKKDGSGKTSISEKELLKLLNIPVLDKKLNNINTRLAELEKLPTANKDNVLELINKEFLKSGELINISAPPSIEKDKKIKVGSIYYHPSKGVRLKTKEGWTSLNLD